MAILKYSFKISSFKVLKFSMLYTGPNSYSVSRKSYGFCFKKRFVIAIPQTVDTLPDIREFVWLQKNGSLFIWPKIIDFRGIVIAIDSPLKIMKCQLKWKFVSNCLRFIVPLPSRFTTSKCEKLDLGGPQKDSDGVRSFSWWKKKLLPYT